MPMLSPKELILTYTSGKPWRISSEWALSHGLPSPSMGEGR
jgi:hypothetical protein